MCLSNRDTEGEMLRQESIVKMEGKTGMMQPESKKSQKPIARDSTK